MFAKILRTVVQKTAKATGVKLGVPADRIGQGLRASNANPTDNLSPGPLPSPSIRNPNRSRRNSCPRCECIKAASRRRPVRPDVQVPLVFRLSCLRHPSVINTAGDGRHGQRRQADPPRSAYTPTPVECATPVTNVTTDGPSATANRAGLASDKSVVIRGADSTPASKSEVTIGLTQRARSD